MGDPDLDEEEDAYLDDANAEWLEEHKCDCPYCPCEQTAPDDGICEDCRRGEHQG